MRVVDRFIFTSGSLIESEAGRVEPVANLIVITCCRDTGKNATRDQWIDVQSLAAENIKLACIAVIVNVSVWRSWSSKKKSHTVRKATDSEFLRSLCVLCG
jgi:hypothetical protein